MRCGCDNIGLTCAALTRSPIQSPIQGGVESVWSIPLLIPSTVGLFWEWVI